MRSTIGIALLALIGCCGVIGASAAREVTHEEIKDGMMSLVHSFITLDNKLERHEVRSRSVGEFMKRAFQALQKGQKQLEPINGIFIRLDERINQIETMLLAQEERHNTQSDKMVEALGQIFKWMQENNECFNKRDKEVETFRVPEVKAVPLTDNTEFIAQVGKLSGEIKELKDTSKLLSEQTSNLSKLKLLSAEDILSKMNESFTNVLFTQDHSIFEDNVAKQLKHITGKLENLNVEIPKVAESLTELDKSFIKSVANATLASVEDIKADLLAASDKALSRTTTEITDNGDKLASTMTNMAQTISDSVHTADTFYADLNETYANLEEKLDVFDKFNKVLLVNSEYVLDTQRKVEFGTHQVIQKVGDIIRSLNSDLNDALQKRFDDVDSSIVSNHLEALQNISSTMESEIGHVWRQIEIMHSEIAFSKDALNKLQGQTEVYVNGTVTTMDSMEAKVLQITGRMSEVDSNLNYLLGRLSLVTQEFNQIKSGLGTALDQIRSSFQTVQDKISPPGPGPHQISSDEVDIEENLLSKRAV